MGEDLLLRSIAEYRSAEAAGALTQSRSGYWTGILRRLRRQASDHTLFG